MKQVIGVVLSYLSLTGNIKIPDTVTSIGTNAFALNNLTDIDNGPSCNQSKQIIKKQRLEKFSLLLCYNITNR